MWHYLTKIRISHFASHNHDLTITSWNPAKQISTAYFIKRISMPLQITGQAQLVLSEYDRLINRLALVLVGLRYHFINLSFWIGSIEVMADQAMWCWWQGGIEWKVVGKRIWYASWNRIWKRKISLITDIETASLEFCSERFLLGASILGQFFFIMI